MTRLTERQLERTFCAMEKRRDAVRKAATNNKLRHSTRMALARAADALSDALRAIQSEANR